MSSSAAEAFKIGFDDTMEHRMSVREEDMQRRERMLNEFAPIKKEVLECMADILEDALCLEFQEGVIEIPVFTGLIAGTNIVYRPPMGVVQSMVEVQQGDNVVQIALENVQTPCGYRARACLANCPPEVSEKPDGLALISLTLYLAFEDVGVLSFSEKGSPRLRFDSISCADTFGENLAWHTVLDP